MRSFPSKYRTSRRDGKSPLWDTKTICNSHPDAVIPWSPYSPLGRGYCCHTTCLPGGKVTAPVDLGALAASGQVALSGSQTTRGHFTHRDRVSSAGKCDPTRRHYRNLTPLFLGSSGLMNGAGRPSVFQFQGMISVSSARRYKTAASGNDLILLKRGISAGVRRFFGPMIEVLGSVLVARCRGSTGPPGFILGMIRIEDAK